MRAWPALATPPGAASSNAASFPGDASGRSLSSAGDTAPMALVWHGACAVAPTPVAAGAPSVEAPQTVVPGTFSDTGGMRRAAGAVRRSACCVPVMASWLGK
jgi:hypothetical protein